MNTPGEGKEIKADGPGLSFGIYWLNLSVGPVSIAQALNDHIRAHYVRKEDYDEEVGMLEDFYGAEKIITARLSQELSAAKADLAAELEGNSTLRKMLGASENEGMFALAERIKKERDRLKAELESLKGAIHDI